MVGSAQRSTPLPGRALAAVCSFRAAFGGSGATPVRSRRPSGRRALPARACLLVALLAAAPAAVAQPWSPLGAEFRVNSSTTGQQSNPAIATDADGEFVIVWAGEGLGDDQGILGQRFQSNGVPAGTEFWANDVTGGSQGSPSVGRADNGDFVVVWDHSYAGAQDVWAQRFSSTGSRVGSNFRVNATNEPNQQSNQVAVLPDGRFIVVWTARLPVPPGAVRGEPTDSEIIVRRFAADASPLGSELQVNTYTTNEQSSATIAASSAGDFVVAWESPGQDGDLTAVQGQRFSSSGGKLGTEFRVNSYTTDLQYTSSVALTDDGGFVVVWTSRGQDGNYRGVFGQRFNSVGGKVGGEFQANAYTTGPQGPAVVLTASNGGFLVAWDFPEVHAKLYGRKGPPLSGEFVLNSYLTSLQADPQLSGDANGQFVATWISFGQDGDVLGIYAQRFMGPIFLDGFESGDTTAWSSTVPP